ncbi:ABC transporter permease subunit [Salsipaludibacter albus]|uniref:ABC transporter permease subunit n=1 Tax=Salsipaludibacter albus TaxID=2849650 RepID=UPI001EE3D422|nr:ABC transporter permease subunit [Salsipaludibacter albus]MBY5162454.1 ABC transporter permease [Salsipaludibacter albus]
MLLSSIFAKSVRDRWTGELVAGIAMAVLLWMTMAIYADFDVSFYYDLPEAAQQLAGIDPAVGGLAGLAYGSIYNLLGALTLAGIAISIGASGVAGEERDGTISLLLGNPRSRSRLLGAKTTAMVVLSVFGLVLLWIGGLASPAVLDQDVSGVNLVALLVHLGANAVLWGLLATAIGAWTGNRTAASGAAAGLMVGSYLAASIVPLFPDVADWAAVSPWYWFSGANPAANGIDAGYLALQLGTAALLAAVAFVGVNRRDLRERRGRTTLVDRLRSHPMTQRYADRVAGSARVSSLVAKASSDHQALLVVVGGIVAMLGLYYGPMYNLIPEAFADAMNQFPDALMSMIGQADISTGAGWLQAELFSLVVPIGFITVLVSVGAKSLAGEEADRTMGLLLANPVSRSRVLFAKAAVLVLYAVALVVIASIGALAGALLGGLDVSLPNVVVTMSLGGLLGLVMGAVAFLVGAATGRVRWATSTATGVALLAYFAWSFLPLSQDLAGWADWSPFDWYLGSDPLLTGVDWTDVGLFVVTITILVVLAVPMFARRDLRG